MSEPNDMFLESYDLYSDEIFRFALFKFNDREKSKEIVQEVFMKMWIYMTKKNDVKNARAFLYKTASNMIIDEYRKSERRDGKSRSLDELSELGYDVGFDDTESWADKIDGDQVLKLVKELPDIYAEVIFLRYVEEKTISEIGILTEQTDNAVSVRINRGLKRLKEIVSEKQKGQNHE